MSLHSYFHPVMPVTMNDSKILFLTELGKEVSHLIHCSQTNNAMPNDTAGPSHCNTVTPVTLYTANTKLCSDLVIPHPSYFHPVTPVTT